MGTGNNDAPPPTPPPPPPVPSAADDDDELAADVESNCTEDRSGTIRLNAGMVVFANAC